MSVLRYVEAIGRNSGEERQHSHLYAINDKGEYLPLCIYGWNRSDGARFSIFRGHTGARGLCKICDKRRKQGFGGIEDAAGSHKTKWL